MKTLLSGNLILLVTALMVTLSFGCGEGVEGETGSQSAQLTAGQCNALVATALGASQQCFGSECGPEVCEEVGANLLEFIGDAECATGLLAGELNGLPAGNGSQHRDDGPKEGALKRNGEVICNAISQCGLCVFLPEGFCPGFC